MASASITFVLNRLADQAVKEAALLRGTRDVAHEVEDVLDEFLRKADLDRLAAGRSRWGRWLKLATIFTTQVAVRHDLRERMDGIKDRLKEISDNVDKYWRKQLRSNASPSAPNPSPSVPGWDEGTKVFGFQKECKELEKHLLDTDSGRSVISIVGESGIGKSTLAWKVYDSRDITEQFDVRAWINVPPQIKENDILYFIYKRLCSYMDREAVSSSGEIDGEMSEESEGGALDAGRRRRLTLAPRPWTSKGDGGRRSEVRAPVYAGTDGGGKSTVDDDEGWTERSAASSVGSWSASKMAWPAAMGSRFRALATGESSDEESTPEKETSTTIGMTESSEGEGVAKDAKDVGFVSWKEQVQDMSGEEFEAFLRTKAKEILNRAANGVLEELADKVMGEEDDWQQEKEGLEDGVLSGGDKEVEMVDRVKEATACPEGDKVQVRASPRLQRSRDEHTLAKAEERVARKNLEFSKGNSSSHSLFSVNKDPALVFLQQIGINLGESNVEKDNNFYNLLDLESEREVGEMGFDEFCLEYESEEESVEDIEKKALKSLCGDLMDEIFDESSFPLNSELDDFRHVHNALLKYLEDKRYLVMVDGLANFTNWNSILQSLPDNGNRSRVMIITRLEDKEEAAYADPKIKLVKIKNLSKEDSEDLFHRRLRRANKVSGGENLEPDQMEKACNNMYEITKGIPLAVVLLGGLLRTKDTKEWNKVFKQLKSSEEPKRVKRILALCFDDLPSRLKSCFLYFAGMPENLIYNARRIVRLWAAEGFLKPRKGKTIEDIGQSYLKELISRGMIQLVKKDINGGVWLVAIHDRLHAFAQLEAQEASFLETLDIKRTKVVKVAQAFWEIPTLRHIAANKLQLPKSVGALNNMQTLTGLVCCDPWGNNMSPLNNMVFLRNLEISGLNENHWKGLADAFKKLESLLYLHLAGKGIPSELFTKFNLRRLQILELFGEVDTSSDKVEEQYTLPNLTRIVLKKTKVDKNFMDKIGELPSLTELVLSDESYVGEKLVFSDSGFNHITNLVMTHLPELLQWEIRPHSIPRIKKITVADCPKMKIKLHCKNEDQGLEGLMADLKEVVVWNMHEEISIEPENKALRDMIKRVTMNTKSDEITSAMQRTGRWRAGMIAGDMYHN
ncbi:unnamed protein product [Urochloa decumbens]|uniref:Uncharacterized protein n=1 Tax=Urochloa decumbens TaxID=240449 RepID=A0ABC9DQH4_9POAL